jgi:cation diffusion facilitator family transporter
MALRRTAVAHQHADRSSHPPAHAGHRHLHGVADPAIVTTARGMWALKWSCVGLLVTAGFQLVVVALSGSVALLADTIHNFGDAATALPLWVAFSLARRRPTERFTYGFGRLEDLAGMAIVLIMALSAILAGYEAIMRLFHPQPVAYLGTVAVASLVGFLGNEAVAIFRIKVGQAIGSAALIADGYHARVDGWTSLAVLAGALGVWLGYPLADPVIGLVITTAILWLVWQSGTMVVHRALDGVDPEVIHELRHAAVHVPEVRAVTEVQARWVGHYLRAEVSIAVASALSVAEGHAIAKEVRHQLLHHVRYLSGVIVHVDPADEAGAHYHQIAEHIHDGLPAHAHEAPEAASA